MTRTDSGRVMLGFAEQPGDDVRAQWDALVTSTPGTDVTQLSAWARVRAGESFRPLYLFVRPGTCLVGGAQVLLRHVHGFGRLGYVSYGPIVAPDVEGRQEVVEALARGLGSLTGIRMLFVQPPEDGDDVRHSMLAGGFRCSAAGIAPAGPVRVDLTRSEEDIRSGLPPRLRSWTRRWAA